MLVMKQEHSLPRISGIDIDIPWFFCEFYEFSVLEIGQKGLKWTKGGVMCPNIGRTDRSSIYMS